MSCIMSEFKANIIITNFEVNLFFLKFYFKIRFHNSTHVRASTVNQNLISMSLYVHSHTQTYTNTYTQMHLYTYIYMCVWGVFHNNSPGKGCDTMSVFQRSTAGLNFVFSFPKAGWLTKVNESNQPDYLLITGPL